MAKKKDLTGGRFGRLVVLEELPERINNRVVWKCKCDCGNTIDVKGIYLTTGQTTSCGCFKKDLEKNHLRNGYDAMRVDGVAKQLFKGKEPRNDSSTGYRGVAKYYTKGGGKLKYRAWITVKGKQYYKSGFDTPEDAYYKGRLELEKKHLPGKDEEK